MPQMAMTAGPEWPRHSPLLFPIIGEVRGEQIRVRGKVYSMLRHGVARDHGFAFVERSPQSCKLLQINITKLLYRPLTNYGEGLFVDKYIKPRQRFPVNLNI